MLDGVRLNDNFVGHVQTLIGLKVRAGVEMALIDAVAKSIGVPLWRLFGGALDTITTNITVNTCLLLNA